jgi:hypothetical protein
MNLKFWHLFSKNHISVLWGRKTLRVALGVSQEPAKNLSVNPEDTYRDGGLIFKCELPSIPCWVIRITKVGVLRASHKIFNSEVRICWNDASKSSSISSSQLTFCCVSSAKLKISWHHQCRDKESIVNTEHRLRDFGKVASIKQYLPSQKSLPIGGASAADLCQPKFHLTLFL